MYSKLYVPATNRITFRISIKDVITYFPEENPQQQYMFYEKTVFVFKNTHTVWDFQLIKRNKIYM